MHSFITGVQLAGLTALVPGVERARRDWLFAFDGDKLGALIRVQFNDFAVEGSIVTEPQAEEKLSRQ